MILGMQFCSFPPCPLSQSLYLPFSHSEKCIPPRRLRRLHSERRRNSSPLRPTPLHNQRHRPNAPRIRHSPPKRHRHYKHPKDPPEYHLTHSYQIIYCGQNQEMDHHRRCYPRGCTRDTRCCCLPVLLLLAQERSSCSRTEVSAVG